MAFEWREADLSGHGLFLSDMHLDRYPIADKQLAAYIAYLATQPPDWLCLGGDTFDFLVGDNKVCLQRFAWFLDGLVALQRAGTRLYMLEGNHDFHLAGLSAKIPGLQVVPDGLWDPELSLYLLHGDYQTAGFIYRPVRKLFRSSITQTAAKVLPDALVYNGARTWSSTSHKMHGESPQEDYLRYIEACMQRAMREHAKQCPATNMVWIMGHIHAPMKIEQDGHICYVNDAWHPNRSALVIDTSNGIRIERHCWSDDAGHLALAKGIDDQGQ